MAAIRVGTLIDCMAQIVELLFEQWSMPSAELVERTALAARYDLIVRIFVPAEKVRLSLACRGCAGSMLFTTCITMLPSFFSNFSGRAVLMNSGMLGSMRSSRAAPS